MYILCLQLLWAAPKLPPKNDARFKRLYVVFSSKNVSKFLMIHSHTLYSKLSIVVMQLCLTSFTMTFVRDTSLN